MKQHAAAESSRKLVESDGAAAARPGPSFETADAFVPIAEVSERKTRREREQVDVRGRRELDATGDF